MRLHRVARRLYEGILQASNSLRQVWSQDHSLTLVKPKRNWPLLSRRKMHSSTNYNTASCSMKTRTVDVTYQQIFQIFRLDWNDSLLAIYAQLCDR